MVVLVAKDLVNHNKLRHGKPNQTFHARNQKKKLFSNKGESKGKKEQHHSARTHYNRRWQVHENFRF